jgi:amylosucrase
VVTRDWISEESERSLDRLLDHLEPVFSESPEVGEVFRARLEEQWERIFRLSHELYGWQWDFSWHLVDLIETAARASRERSKWLRKRDVVDAGAAWMSDPSSFWAMTYLDRFAGTVDGLRESIPHLESLGISHLHLMPPYAVPEGPNDGGYAVSDYRRLRPDLGTREELASMAKRLHKHGIGLVLDFVANHTAHDHPWAEAAKRGERPYDRFYFMFDDRTEVEPWLPHLREIFPAREGDAFTWHADVQGPKGGKWVWTTFYPYQWDLDYSKFAVLVAVAGELLSIANIGASVVRMDATPFLWKQQGTSCENLPQSHTVLQLLNAVMAVVAPSVRFLSEAIVHPDGVARFVRPDECGVSYNPLLMSVIWEALATRDTILVADALLHRQALPDDTQWITYLRSHDDIGWGFADEDAVAHSIEPTGHRKFLNEFYSGEFPGSFASGATFQENPRTGDARISGTLASLAGMERALATADASVVDLAVKRIIAIQTVAFTSIGIPMIFLGDELATCNDHRFGEDPAHADDNRWMHRPRYDWAALKRANDHPASPAGRVLNAIRQLADVRSLIPGIDRVPNVLATGDERVLAYRHSASNRHAVTIVNFSEDVVPIHVDDLELAWSDIHTGSPVELQRLMLPYQAVVAVASEV